MLWIVCAILAGLCVASINYGLPAVCTLVCFIAALAAAAMALLPKPRRVAAHERISLERIYDYDPARIARR